MRPAAAFCVALIAGALLAAAFDPWSVPYAGIAAVAALLVVLRCSPQASAGVVFGAGLCFGGAFLLVATSWMRAVSTTAYLSLAAFEAVVIAATVVAMHRVLRAPAWPLATAAVWTTGEWVRGTVPFGGFPWSRLSYSAVDTPWSHWARWTGMPTTTFVMALTAALAAAAVTTDAPRWRLAAGGCAMVLGLVAWALPVGPPHLDGTRDVALIQGNTPGAFLTWPRGEITDLHLVQTARFALDVDAGRADAPDLVVWPENAMDADPQSSPLLRQRLQNAVASVGAPILVGGIFDGDRSGTAKNAGVVWTPAGPADHYVKRHPVPFGEYVPMRGIFGPLVPRFDRDIPRDMLPGDETGLLHAAGVVWGDLICFDIAHDSAVRDVAGAAVLVVQTSNAAYTGTAQPDQQWAISRMRAVETGRQVVVASTNGVTGVIDADGSVVSRAPVGEPATVSATVRVASGRTPGVILGPWLELLWACLAAGLLAAPLVRRRPA